MMALRCIGLGEQPLPIDTRVLDGCLVLITKGTMTPVTNVDGEQCDSTSGASLHCLPSSDCFLDSPALRSSSRSSFGHAAKCLCRVTKCKCLNLIHRIKEKAEIWQTSID